MSQPVSDGNDCRVLDAYETVLKQRGFRDDAAQRAAMLRLQSLCDELLAYDAASAHWLRRLVARPRVPRSVYLWGGVGRGKTFLMDCFFDVVPQRSKRRVHFHAFMQEVQSALRNHNREPDPLARVIEGIADQTRLLCFDEFHVSDIADAMILGRLLEGLLERGVAFVMTSNYPPEGLYPNGLQRIRFVPTIDLLTQRFDVVEVDDGTDYRLRALVQMETYLVPAGRDAETRMREDFLSLAQRRPEPDEIEVLGRRFPVRGHAPGVIWFDFDTLCGGPRSQNDYLEIAREHHTVLLSGVPRMSAEMASEARRFTWLIDVLYDHRVKLVVSAEVAAPQLYPEGLHANEFFRTVSRLREMRGTDYLAAAHRSG